MGKGQIKSGIALLIYISAALYASSSHALSLAQQPLFLTSGADPNLMFVLDDSGSMMYEVTPEYYRFDGSGNSVYVFPPADDVYGNGETFYDSPVAPGSLSVYGKLLRSKINRSYYDPAKLYRPWLNADGTSMPNADAECAWHNPMKTSTTKTEAYCRKLTEEDDRIFADNTWSWRTCTKAKTCSSNTSSTKYYPATYYWYTGAPAVVGVAGADEWDGSKYIEVQIKSTTENYTGDGRGSARTDCGKNAAGDVSCTYAQEIQNFANWYTYYRSRILLARAGIGRAFVKQEDNLRIGFGAINKGKTAIDGVADTYVLRGGVRKFTQEQKNSFINYLYGEDIAGGTPLRFALDQVGKYYQRVDNYGPWAKTPGTEDLTAHVACRASYAMLMTDGYWNDDAPANIGNQDNTGGSAIENHIPEGKPSTYTYSAAAPYKDDQSDTLADVAMKYWKTDLRTLDNRVKPNDVDPAFWQHMTTFTIGLGVTGTLPSMNVANTIKNKTAINWPLVSAGSSVDEKKIDDMVHAAVNGHGDFFSAQEPEEFADRLADMLNDLNKREKNNAAAAAANSTSLTSGSVVYRASFDSGKWTGQLVAREIKPDGTYGIEHWQASIPMESSRNIFTYTGTAGIEFLWDKLTETQKNLIGSGTSSSAGTYGSQRLNWVRGVNTASADADLRERDSLLGDIVNSSPVFAGRNNMNFDRLPAALGGEKYKAYFDEKKKNRREVIYVGANDGMLHAFDATMGATDTKKDGEEVFAYIPSSQLGQFKKLASQNYGKIATNQHKFMVDGQVFVSDAYINGEWKNILVGTLGAGGRGIYVLDVTDPNNFKAENVLFELTETNYPKLGNISGTPIIAPGKDNRWKIYLGNGYNSDEVSGSTTADDKGYLAIIDIENEIAKTGGALFLETDGVAGNALSEPALLPDPKGYIVAAYAGDLRGNLWKYNLSSESAGNWARADGATPLFTAINKLGRQPITTSPTLGFNTLLSPARVMVYFGTGRYAASDDNIPVTNGDDFQSFYAIADKGTAVNSNRSTLHEKTITGTAIKRTIGGEVTASGENAVDWKTKDGWFLDFPKNERIVVKPQLYYDRLIFPTVIPTDDPCLSGGSSWVMELIAVGNSDLKYSLLGKSANVYENVLILAEPMMLAGTKQRSTSSVSAGATSSFSSSEGQCESGTMINVMTNINDESRDKSGTRPCPLFNRQSWRELEN